MSRKQIIIASAAAILVVVLVLIAVFVPKFMRNNDASETNPSTQPTGATNVQTQAQTEATQRPTGTVATQPQTTEENKQSSVTDEKQVSDQKPAEPAKPETPEPTQAPKPVQPQVPDVPETTEPEVISFPYTIPNTTLEIETVNSYDGIYVEDGSDIEISGVSAIILRNTGDQCVDYTKIQMRGSKTDFEFVASGIEAGATVAVMESGKAPAVAQDYEQITAEVALTDKFERSEGIIEVRETEESRLEITNKSGKDIPCVRIFYKFYMEDEQMYVGGITYTAKITDLKAGTSVEVAPSHYALGGSKVIMVKTYDTDEN